MVTCDHGYTEPFMNFFRNDHCALIMGWIHSARKACNGEPNNIFQPLYLNQHVNMMHIFLILIGIKTTSQRYDQPRGTGCVINVKKEIDKTVLNMFRVLKWQGVYFLLLE